MKKLTSAVMVGLLAAHAGADVVTDWNTVLLDSIRLTSTNPPRAARAMAMVHGAMYDAVNGTAPWHEPYLLADAAPAGTSPEAAAAAAAHRVLVVLYPARVDVFDAALAASLAGIPAGQRARGIAYGELAAQAMLAARADDNSNLLAPYAPGDDAGDWAPTPPAFAPALLPNWPLVTPFCMPSGSAYRSPGPPDLAGAEYAAAVEEVRSLGAVDSSTRSPEQTEIALFWADGAATVTPPGHWLEIARGVSAQRGLSLAENARLFALLSFAACDASVAAWDSKYAFNHWRPVTAIRAADSDGNPATDPDPTWSPLIATPPFPSYTSGHSTFSAAAAVVLAEFFGTDAVAFTSTSGGLPGVTRGFTSFSAAAEEAGRSRIYGGIHYEYDNQHGLAAGRAIGADAFAGFLAPIGDLTEDGHVTQADVSTMLEYLAADDPAGDVNDDGRVNGADLAIVVRQLVRGPR